jgi:hypothetical protein
MNDFTRTALVVVFPLASILVPAVLTWAKDLNALSRRIRRLDEQTKIVGFWDNWMKVEQSAPAEGKHPDFEAEQMISSIKKTVRREIAEAGREILAIYRMREVDLFRRYPMTFIQFQEYRSRVSRFKRALLLYKAAHPLAALRHSLFYALSIQSIVGAGIALWELVATALGKPHLLPSLHHPRLLPLRIVLLTLYPVAIAAWMRLSAFRSECDPSNYIRDQIYARYEPPGIEKIN